jgi:tyrosyl-tRNA synthetase
MKSVDEQMQLIQRGVAGITTEEELRSKLKRSVATGKPLRVKYGIDPTGIDVHLGHTVPLRKLRLFQELGHQAVLIIGNYTALVGDPSGRDQSRARLTPEQVGQNAIDYLRQISKIIDIERTEKHHNGDWFGKFDFLRVMKLCSSITIQRMLERDDFTKRVQSGTPIYLHECLYPLMQGWDSVEIHADIELGGTEQLFNLMRGRDLQSEQGQEPQICITLPILRGLDGQRRMGKSLGNYIGVGEPAQQQFDKVMSIPDHLMREWFELLTDRSAADIDRLCDPTQGNPRDSKWELGKDIVRFYHGADVAEAACAEWIKKNTKRELPTDIAEKDLSAADLADGKMGIVKLVAALGLAASNNEARRAVEAGAVSIGPDKQKVTDPKAAVAVTDGLIVRNGPRKIVRVRLK